MENLSVGLGLFHDVVTLERAIMELIAAKEMANRRPAYVRTLKSYLTMFSRGWEGTPIREVGRRQVEEWFRGRNEAPTTRQTGMLVLSVLFEFAIRAGYCEANPIKRMDKVRIDRKPPRILTPKEARKLLNFTRRKIPWRLPQVVLGLYAGIRPAELTRLTWDKINMERGYVTIDAAAAKTRRRRIVHLDPKAIAWLKRCRQFRRNRLGLGSKCRKWRQSIEESCGFSWSPDLLRHTAASYLLAKYQDAGKVSRMLGNTEAVLLGHYFELVTPEDCRRFWKCTINAKEAP